MRVLAIAAFVTGCSIPDKFLIDGGVSGDGMKDSTTPDTPTTGPFGCLGQPVPSAAPSTIVGTGHVQSLLNAAPIANATFELFSTVSGQALPPTTASDASGSYVANISTQGVPVDGYLRISATSYMQTYLYPGAPLFRNLQAELVMTTAADLGTLMSAGVAGPYDATKASAIILVSNCDGVPLAGATLVTNAMGGSIRYQANGMPSMPASQTDASGLVWIFNAQEGLISVNAMVSGMTLRAHVINLHTGTFMMSTVRPGP